MAVPGVLATSVPDDPDSVGGGELTLAEWLKASKLSELQSVFDQHRLTIDEFAQFAITDVRQIGKEMGLYAIQIARLVNACKKLRREGLPDVAGNPDAALGDEVVMEGEELDDLDPDTDGDGLPVADDLAGGEDTDGGYTTGASAASGGGGGSRSRRKKLRKARKARKKLKRKLKRSRKRRWK